MFRSLIPVSRRFPGTFVRMENDLGSLMDRFFNVDEELWAPTEAFNPRTSVAETEKAIEVSVELPGMKAEDFNVEVHGDELWISGEKKEEHEESGKTFHRVERRYGKFQRTIGLSSDVDAEKIVAEYKDGLLKVTLAKSPAAQAKRIPIQA